MGGCWRRHWRPPPLLVVLLAVAVDLSPPILIWVLKDRSDLTGTEMNNRFAGNKQSNLDSAFMGSSRDGFPQVGPESLDGLHLMKILRNVGGEKPRRSHDEAMFFGMHPMRPTLTSRVLQPPTRSRTDASWSKWERAIPLNVGPSMQYPPRVGQVASFGGQVPSNRFKDANLGSGILSSINASNEVSERNPSGVLLPGGKQKSGTHNSEPESLTPRPSQHGSISSSRQMTIFHGGQAHVFDDIHSNKVRKPAGLKTNGYLLVHPTTSSTARRVLDCRGGTSPVRASQTLYRFCPIFGPWLGPFRVTFLVHCRPLLCSCRPLCFGRIQQQALEDTLQTELLKSNRKAFRGEEPK
ncbi:hypothetical protein TEA_028922 [Camellia sinensis var. sinensis]|uniref:Tify domain-containing protein n=1 Tax=Camellia sinensis var. sinensis TaxID=542762 RepID=A0A4S4EHQ7_CAMSN|nr:hypothetical protein TEA_028922 [Camellia sinensis var. sinensis]